MIHTYVVILIVSALCLHVASSDVYAQDVNIPGTPFIFDSLEISRATVYDTAGALDILNQIHWTTREGVIEDEVFFDIGDTVTANDLNELERNLRQLEVFSRIAFDIIPNEEDEHRAIPRATLRIRTKDSWSLRTGGALSTSSDGTVLLGTLREVNLFGYATQLGGSLEYSTINDRGWRITGFAYQPNIEGTHINVGVSGAKSKFETSGALRFERPYYSERVSSAFAVGASHYTGDEFFYRPFGEQILVDVSHTRTSDASGWYSVSRGAKGSLVFGSASLIFDRSSRDSVLPFYPRAFENSIGAFVGIQSIRRVYERLNDADMSGDRLIPIGGLGSVSIGKISPHSGGLDNVAYLGAEAREAGRLDALHLYGSIAAGTGLKGKEARFTSERFIGAAHLQLPFGALAARLDQSAIWNWPRYVAMMLDNPNGLRGYDRNQLIGDNRIVANVEYRMFPIGQVWLFDIGAALFYDVGAVWSQGQTFTGARYHSSVGAGLRIGSAHGTFSRGLLRVDVAYNLDDGRLSKIIISSHEAFDAFGSLEYHPPGPYLP